MKKIIILTLILSVLLSCTALSISAEEITSELGDVALTTAVPTDSVPLDEAIADDAKTETLIAETVKAFVEEYLSEIASIATIILTTVLIFLQKKGLLPIITKSFSSLVDMLNAFKKNIETKVSSLDEKTKPVIERMDRAIDGCEKMEKRFSDLQKLFELEQEEKKLLEKKIEESNERDMLTCEMLYQLLMCTNVPQYMKDKIADFYESSKATIAKGSTDSKAVTHDEAVS